MSDARGAAGKPDTGFGGSGGTGGTGGDGGTGGTSATQESSASLVEEPDANPLGGSAGGAGGSGGVGGADAGMAGRGGAGDAQRADGTVSSAGSSEDGGLRRDSSDQDAPVSPTDSNGGSGEGADGGADALSVADSGDATDLAIDLSPDLYSPDLYSPDLAFDLPADQATCTPTTYDAKNANHSAGWAESDGWCLNETGMFLWVEGRDYQAGRTTVTIVARGDFISGAWPTMEITAQGRYNIIGSAEVSSTSMTGYSFPFDAVVMNSGAGVTVKSGKGLHVQSITIGCPTN